MEANLTELILLKFCIYKQDNFLYIEQSWAESTLKNAFGNELDVCLQE